MKTSTVFKVLSDLRLAAHMFVNCMKDTEHISGGDLAIDLS